MGDARGDLKLQDLPARQLCPPSLLLLDRLVSIVQEAQFAGEEAGVASQLAPRQLSAASCLLARLSESGRQGEGSVKGEGEWVSQREREREGEREMVGGRESAVRAQVYLPQPIKPASLGDSAKSTAGPRVMSEPQQPVTAAEAGRRYGAPTEPKSPAKWGSSLATLL
ncbi:hypothetical protein GBF38_008948 [Nibea albiflora]|uniref:Uncharacterized protein n=1 Tax=Nibea albiflora TaxID=240163 RepID=A0ACB7EQY1_NIBAL|nr:hypothetical protein GBF38_008948 [Nibea albiflora]